MPSVAQDKAQDQPQDRLAAGGKKKHRVDGLAGGWRGQRQLCETQGRSCSPFLSLSLMERLVVDLLLGDEETQLSPATALDGQQASMSPPLPLGQM